MEYVIRDHLNLHGFVYFNYPLKIRYTFQTGEDLKMMSFSSNKSNHLYTNISNRERYYEERIKFFANDISIVIESNNKSQQEILLTSKNLLVSWNGNLRLKILVITDQCI